MVFGVQPTHVAENAPSPVDALDAFATGRWQFLTTGTTAYSGRQKRRLVLTNVIIYMTSSLMLFYAGVFALVGGAGLISPIAVNLCVGLALLLTPYLHPYHPLLGTVYNLLLWLGFGVFTSYSFGSGAGIHFFFLSGVASAILIMGVRQNIVSFMNIMVQVGLFMYFDQNHAAPAAYVDVSRTGIAALYLTSVPIAVAFIFCMILYAFVQAARAETLLQREYEFSENLLGRMLPRSIANQLKQHPGKTIANYHDDVTILFADLVGFTRRSNTQSPEKLVAFLNALFTRFDMLAERHGVEKIKTIGDAFMVAGGMPDPTQDHASRVAALALEMKSETKRFAAELEENFEIRIGIASGRAVAGVIGTQKPFYDVWGVTVNLAARLEASARPGAILISHETRKKLTDRFHVKTHGEVDLKGVGQTIVYQLVS
ncbi:MAG: adenylate/guanylate cyclase domain-containing protein [Pseudomonadota bacterium]